MTDTITLTGLVATIPRHVVASGNLPITSFRLASTQRRYDRAQGQWVDAETNWYTVSAFRQLAHNAAQSLQKGDRVVVTGRVRLRDWATAEKSGTTVDVEADALGHDLTWGTATWQRTSSGSTSGVAGGPSSGEGLRTDQPDDAAPGSHAIDHGEADAADRGLAEHTTGGTYGSADAGFAERAETPF